MDNSNKYLTAYDEQLSNITNLKWLPWIGHQYEKTRLLIIGDSFYDDGKGWPENDLSAPRSLIENQGLNPDFPNKGRFLKKVANTILDLDQKSTPTEIENFWTSVAYFNLIQRGLTSRKERPINEDFDLGWETVLRVAEILQPKICIKLGIAGIGRLGYIIANENSGWHAGHGDFQYKPYKLYAINLYKSSYHSKILCIHHPTGSRYFPKYWPAIRGEFHTEFKQAVKFD